jgi:hypothetical protein
VIFLRWGKEVTTDIQNTVVTPQEQLRRLKKTTLLLINKILRVKEKQIALSQMQFHMSLSIHRVTDRKKNTHLTNFKTNIKKGGHRNGSWCLITLGAPTAKFEIFLKGKSFFPD